MLEQRKCGVLPPLRGMQPRPRAREVQGCADGAELLPSRPPSSCLVLAAPEETQRLCLNIWETSGMCRALLPLGATRLMSGITGRPRGPQRHAAI